MDNIAQILQARTAAEHRGRARNPSPSVMPFTPPRRTGATRCCTSCSPIVFPMARSTRDPLLDRTQSRRATRGVRGGQRSARVALGHCGGSPAKVDSRAARWPASRASFGYLANLGVTTLWIAPVFRQRVEGNDFHGYGVQDFLEVDSRFGTRADLVELVRAAHAIGMRVVLDIIFNHTGSNWLYDAAETGDAFRPKYTTGQYKSLFPKNGFGGAITNPQQPLGNDDYVWPQDLQFIENYTRAGTGSLGAGDIRDPQRRTQAHRLRGAARPGRGAR